LVGHTLSGLLAIVFHHIFESQVKVKLVELVHCPKYCDFRLKYRVKDTTSFVNEGVHLSYEYELIYGYFSEIGPQAKANDLYTASIGSS